MADSHISHSEGVLEWHRKSIKSFQWPLYSMIHISSQKKKQKQDPLFYSN